MPDISMCDNKDCVMNHLCFRHTATPSEFSQSYNPYSPKDNTEVSFKCHDFIPNRRHEKIYIGLLDLRESMKSDKKNLR